MMRRGGSAADGAISAAAVLAVVEPMMSGPGGDLFALVRDPRTGRLVGLASAGVAPAALSRASVMRHVEKKADMPTYGALSITVPGAVSGWVALHERFGRLPFATLLQPAIDLAHEGFPVGVQAAEDWRSLAWLRAGRGVLGDFGEAQRVFSADGATPRAGDIFRNRDLALALERIGRDGVEAIARGSIGAAIERATSSAGSPLTRDDLAAHRARWLDPISTRYRGYRVFQMPLPGQGLAVLQLLNLLEGFDLNRLGYGSADHAHLLAEAVRVVWRDRARLYADGPASESTMRGLVEKSYADAQRKMIDMANAGCGDAGPPALSVGDTSTLSVADADGLMINLITSVSGPFGSGIVPPGTGFVLQNRAAGFSLDPNHANALAPGRTPFHTIIPGFAERPDGAPWAAFAVMGGDMQPQGQVQILVNAIDFGMDLQEAGDAPRLRWTGGPQPNRRRATQPLLRLETGWGADVAADLRRRGHQVAVGIADPSVRFGGYQAVARGRSGGWEAASEMRQDGAAGGF